MGIIKMTTVLYWVCPQLDTRNRPARLPCFRHCIGEFLLGSTSIYSSAVVHCCTLYIVLYAFYIYIIRIPQFWMINRCEIINKRSECFHCRRRKPSPAQHCCAPHYSWVYQCRISGWEHHNGRMSQTILSSCLYRAVTRPLSQLAAGICKTPEFVLDDTF